MRKYYQILPSFQILSGVSVPLYTDQQLRYYYITNKGTEDDPNFKLVQIPKPTTLMDGTPVETEDGPHRHSWDRDFVVEP